MKEFLKKNFAIVFAFSLPILLIIIVALSSYIPSAFLKTKYNFIYTACDTGTNYNSYPYYCNTYLQKRYTVMDGKLVVQHVDLDKDLNIDKARIPEFDGKYTARIFLHDTAKNESREITLEEARLLTMNGLLTSPDGVTVSSNYNRGGGEFFPFFGGTSSYGYYLTKGKSKKKLDLINTTDQYYYQNNFQFLGWVLPGRN